MSGVLRLTWRYLCFHRLRTGIIIICLALTFLLPVYLYFLIGAYEASLTERARQTPLVLGPRGNQFELVLRSLYFTESGKDEAGISLADLQDLESRKRGIGIPLHLGYTAGDFPVVGTSLEYFEHRQLTPSRGTLPLILGDAVLGHEVATALMLGPDDHLLTDQTSLYNIGAEQPLRLHVTGVLPRRGSPDDRAVLVDVKTAWVMAGIGHGHDDLEKRENQGQLLGKDEDGSLIGSAAVAPYVEITEANLDSFHFHGDPKTLPLSSLIVVPDSPRSATILEGHYQLSPTLQLLPPLEVIDDLLAIVFKVKRFVDAAFGIVLVMAGLFLLLVMILTWKLRQRERHTLVRIGCTRLTLVWLQVSELVILLGAGLAWAILLAWALLQASGNLLQLHQ